MPEVTTPIVVQPWAKRLIVWCLSFTAFVLSCVAAGSCKFVQQVSGQSVRYFGLFQRLTGSVCVDITNVSVSSSHEAAKAFGALAAIFGGIAMLVLLSVYCVKINTFVWRAVGVITILCILFQGLTFLIFNSDYCNGVNCNLDEGAACSLSAMIFYIFAAVGVFLLPPPSGNDILFDFSGQPVVTPSTSAEEVKSPSSFQEVQPSTSSQEVTPVYIPHQPPPSAVSQQGSPSTSSSTPAKTITEVINPDGSKTVTISTAADPSCPETTEKAGYDEENLSAHSQ